MEPVQEGYLADSEDDDADLQTLQAQLERLRGKPKKRPNPKDKMGESSQGDQEKELRTQEQAGAQQKGTNEKRTRTTSKNVLGLDLDSDWDSNESLHVKTLSDLSDSSGEEGPDNKSESWMTDMRAAVERGTDSTRQMGRGGKDDRLTRGSAAGIAVSSGTGREDVETFRSAAPKKAHAPQARGSQSRKVMSTGETGH